jgi:predicted RNase H-like nuclease (RuvC/YqgF family)
MKEKLHSLSVAHESLAEENGSLIDRLAAASMDATEEEKELAQQTMTELRAIVKTLEAENHALKSSRDQLQSKNAELLKQVAYWRKKYEKTEKVAA